MVMEILLAVFYFSELQISCWRTLKYDYLLKISLLILNGILYSMVKRTWQIIRVTE